jgi:hypothetical protein
MGLNPKSWAEAFVAELTVAGERVPFERVLARHLDTITTLRTASSLTWRSLASLLARAGGRRADGGLISADQLRVGHARLLRHAATKAAGGVEVNRVSRQLRDRPAVRTDSAALAEPASLRPQIATRLATSVPNLPAAQTAMIDDVTDNDIATALSRLTKLPSKR